MTAEVSINMGLTILFHHVALAVSDTIDPAWSDLSTGSIETLPAGNGICADNGTEKENISAWCNTRHNHNALTGTR